jgi:pimeloyl-ACP methyl ester carboxylesterase
MNRSSKWPARMNIPGVAMSVVPLGVGIKCLYQLSALTGWTSLPWLHRLIQPTLILMGNDDPIVPLINGHILTRLIRGARLQIMQDGHLFFVTKPQETALLVEHFIAEE